MRLPVQDHVLQDALFTTCSGHFIPATADPGPDDLTPNTVLNCDAGRKSRSLLIQGQRLRVDIVQQLLRFSFIFYFLVVFAFAFVLLHIFVQRFEVEN